MTTYYVDSAATGANDGSSEANAWTTIDAAMNGVAGSGGHKVWVKASGTYDETASIDTAGTSTAPVVFEGYTSSTGDGGVVTWTKTTSGDCLQAGTVSNQTYYIFKNFHFSSAAGAGVDLSTNDYVTFYNCKATSAGGYGFHVDTNCLFVKCEASNNGDRGFFASTNTHFLGCISHSNTNAQIYNDGDYSIAYRCVVYGTSNSATEVGIRASHIIGCTLDGENGANQKLILSSVDAAANDWFVTVDSVVYDANVGIDVDTSPGMMSFVGYNLLNSNTDDYLNDDADIHFKYGDVSGAPSFTSESTDDYTLGGSSPAIDAGVQPGCVT